MSFTEASAVERLEEGRYRAEIHESWDIGGNANGGYLLAMAARALADEIGYPDPATITAHYLAPGKLGPVEIEVDVLRRGGSFGSASATVRNGERPLLAVLGSFTTLPERGDGPAEAAQFQGVERVEARPPELPAPDDCVSTAEGPGPRFMHKVDLRLHPEDDFVRGPSGHPRVRGWFRWPDDEPLDVMSLLVAVDAFPPTVFNARLPIAWTPTVELTAHVRARPVPGWLRCRFDTRFITGGFLEEDGEVWDCSGRLVAQSRQLALVPRQRRG